MRLGRSVEGTAGSCWGAVHHFLLSPLPPDKHQEGWLLSPAPHCCHQGVAVLRLGIRNKKPDYWQHLDTVEYLRTCLVSDEVFNSLSTFFHAHHLLSGDRSFSERAKGNLWSLTSKLPTSHGLWMLSCKLYNRRPELACKNLAMRWSKTLWDSDVHMIWIYEKFLLQLDGYSHWPSQCHWWCVKNNSCTCNPHGLWQKATVWLVINRGFLFPQAHDI